MDAVEFVQVKCSEMPYAGNRLRIEVDHRTSKVKVTLISETGNVIDEAEFGTESIAYRLASWIETRGNW